MVLYRSGIDIREVEVVFSPLQIVHDVLTAANFRVSLNHSVIMEDFTQRAAGFLPSFWSKR